MVAELKYLVKDLQAELMDEAELRSLLSKLIQNIEGTEDPPGEAQEDTSKNRSAVKSVGGFGGKNVGKPTPWDGEKENEFKAWSEKFTSYMANAGDKTWRNIIK